MLQHRDDDAENPTLENPLNCNLASRLFGDKRAQFDAAMELVNNSDKHPLLDSDDPDVNSWIMDAHSLINRTEKSFSRSCPSASSYSTFDFDFGCAA